MYSIKDIKLATDVVTELLSSSDVKAHLYITHANDDTYITALIKRVRNQIQNYCNISIGSQEWEMIVDTDGYDEIKLPYSPIISVDDVKEKTDYDEYTSIVLNTAYDIDGLSGKYFVPFYQGRFKVEYTAGYTTLPDGLKQGWLAQIAYLYENRGDVNVNGWSEVAKTLIDGYKDYSWT